MQCDINITPKTDRSQATVIQGRREHVSSHYHGGLALALA